MKKTGKVKKASILLVLLLLGSIVSAQNEALFSNATEAYNKGDYNKAIENYLEILDKGQHSPELYFNLGNSYYKLNQIAPSIYYYEKALLLKPNDSEIRNNLAYARNMTLDAIDELPVTGFSKIRDSVTEFLSFEQWARTAVVFLILFVLLYIAFYYFRYSSRKRIAFISCLVSLFVSLIAVVFAFIGYNNFKADRPAIVFSDEIAIRSEPNTRSQEVFTLHEGTKVNVLEELNDFHKVEIADGKTGWVPKESIRLLKDF